MSENGRETSQTEWDMSENGQERVRSSGYNRYFHSNKGLYGGFLNFMNELDWAMSRIEWCMYVCDLGWQRVNLSKLSV
jgi:hypothetical protein